MINTKIYKSYNPINFNLSTITRCAALSIGFICYVINSTAIAATKATSKPVDSTKVTNNNPYKGLKYGVKGDDPYWLALSGGLKLDQRLFFGNTRGQLHSAATLREVSLEFSGGMGKDISLAIGLGFKPATSNVDIEDAYITYSGFKRFGENFQVSIGKVNSSFCLETHSSGKWIPFLERSSVANAFKPDPGLGVSINKWQKDYSINATVTLPKPNNTTFDNLGNAVQHSDRLQYNARLTKAYFFNNNKLIQGGIFGHYKDDGNTGIEFSSPIEANARHRTDTFLNTSVPITNTTRRMIKSKNHYTLGVDLLGQNGPLSGEVEYLTTKVHRDKQQINGPLRFKGYRSNINYVLTGESRAFKNSNGTLGQVIPQNEGGAWEISGRYDYLNLNDKDVAGGSAHHLGFATTWYINYNFSVTAEYIRSNVNKRIDLEKFKVNTLGARLQLVF